MNLLRSIAGNDWGADTATLLTLYRTLIRSVIDFGDIAYDSASKTQLTTLDNIQAHALRICAGTMKNTKTTDLQVELGELLLYLRRLQHQMEFILPILITGPIITVNTTLKKLPSSIKLSTSLTNTEI